MRSQMLLICIIGVELLMCVTGAPITPNTPSGNIPSAEALEFMKRFGYLDPGTPDSDALYAADAIVDAIRTVQKFGAIPQTGELDNKTLELMRSKRCGVPDVDRMKNTRVKRYIIGSEGWKKRDIKYFLANWSPKLSEEVVIEEIQKAFDVWSGYTRLKFHPVRDPSADIIIAFGRGPHGDGYPFDGPGNTLAHAFFPYEMGAYGGDIHFDDDEQWGIKPQDYETGIDFFTVAVHEMGHSLGLSHSPVSTSIMFPYYKGYQPNLQLDYDDILAMYELYISKNIEGDIESPDETSDEKSEGGNENDDKENSDDDNDALDEDSNEKTDNSAGTHNSGEDEWGSLPDDGRGNGTCDDTNNECGSPKIPEVVPTITPTLPTTRREGVTFVGDDETVDDHIRHSVATVEPTFATVPDICNGHYDAIAVLRSELFVFKHEYAWRLSNRNEVQPGYPVPFRYIFWKLPKQITKIDCAYQRETDQNIVLFTGTMYWVFDGDDFVESPRPITDYGLPSDLSHVDACMVWEKNKKTFLFSGDQYWRFNDTTQQLDPGYPHNISRWRGVPYDLDAAMTWTDGLTYFFKGSSFWQFNNKLIKTEDSYPQEASKYWLGCL